ncbi:non-homologous end-joining DNA ligase [Nesterenkonia sp. K-15-9-6]|uniref:non-homologous end-joining DNA ligase n=1 Tax=Nesterenkonia sp. K-15-9-6 TaxID=3093918 RepID=UPI0040440DD7
MSTGSSAQRRRVTVAGRRLSLSNLDKEMYPATGMTKADVQEYLRAVAPVMVPHLRGRPVTRKRWPDGVGTAESPMKPFFRKALEDSAPDWVPRIDQQHQDHTTTYPLVDDEAVLAWFGQVAALELHVPQWRVDDAGDPQPPDRMVLDLDPGDGSDLRDCAQVARWCAELLDGMALTGIPVTSGSAGIHLYAALDGSRTSPEVSAVAQELTQALEKEHPDQVVSRMDRSARRGKVFIDWSQNSRSKTTVAPYSLRGRPRPTVAAPRTWEELEDPDLRQLECDEVLRRVADGLDPLQDLSDSDAVA